LLVGSKSKEPFTFRSYSSRKSRSWCSVECI